MTDLQTRSPYASNPADSRGRQHAQPGPSGEQRGPRDVFQRDRDRIIHSTGFRRLRHKTQVFISPDGDHDRVRLTHSLEVAQIGRTIARALGLNEDLTEALCLAHDIGHPPFGHAGEKALKAALADHGGFDHNGQTLRMVTLLDSPYPRFAGLNLSWETLEGLAKHNGPVTAPGWALAEADAAFPLDLGTHASLEAQVAAVADDIAYDNHDIDDGLRAGLLTLDRLLAEEPFIAATWERVSAAYPDVSEELRARELVRSQIGAMVNDVIEQTRATIAETNPASVDDVRNAGRTIAGFSSQMARDERALKSFMYANLYHHDAQLAAADAAETVIAGLYDAYAHDPQLIDADWFDRLPSAQPGRARHIADYIAGMTDRFACARFAEIYGKQALPAILRPA
ncbi:deoxyguanosinetriphosphate triphosphohydrolase [Sphingorhabdus soli]|uniref:Deoxyguanosinetriphosphate triphosphohydrolase-like protein n=1 Tax=Flavisphingopyxis soli TaxID=2601267 RepID=A0A5C6U7C2_9SPHN|nr:deoxyguanosinetriphosphate triphosphohydrolase [Sphingorhabdus soli]TXC68739.1 deoxyguanosinetriphosphate triphosphohydrolase [Sphingorhabdus soli]